MPDLKNSFKLYKKRELAYLQTPILAETGYVEHGFSTRQGGCSSGPFMSLNTGFHTGDDQANVLENRRRFFELFNCDYRSIVSAVQVHGTEFHVFHRSDSGEGALPDNARRNCDALITEEPHLPLTAFSADCQLLYFATKQDSPLVALAHAGWRGTLGDIGGKVIRYLEDNYGVDSSHLLAGLSPTVCKHCYIIDDQVAEQFKSKGWDSLPYLEFAAGSGGWRLDLTSINTRQLLKAGVKSENIASNQWCTSCDPGLFYSYRRDKGLTGRMLGFIAISKT